MVTEGLPFAEASLLFTNVFLQGSSHALLHDLAEHFSRETLVLCPCSCNRPTDEARFSRKLRDQTRFPIFLQAHTPKTNCRGKSSRMVSVRNSSVFHSTTLMPPASCALPFSISCDLLGFLDRRRLRVCDDCLSCFRYRGFVKSYIVNRGGWLTWPSYLLYVFVFFLALTVHETQLLFATVCGTNHSKRFRYLIHAQLTSTKQDLLHDLGSTYLFCSFDLNNHSPVLTMVKIRFWSVVDSLKMFLPSLQGCLLDRQSW